jgi:hypothetical protein
VEVYFYTTFELDGNDLMEFSPNDRKDIHPQDSVIAMILMEFSPNDRKDIRRQDSVLAMI